MAGDVERKIEELGQVLPTPPEPVGFYVPVLRTGNLVVTSGQLPTVGRELAFKGKLGGPLHVDDGENAARICIVNCLAQVKAEIGELDDVKRIVRVDGFVNSAPGFTDQPKVLNGASQFLVDVFGERGKHTRAAVGVAELPLDAAVEVAVWVEV